MESELASCAADGRLVLLALQTVVDSYCCANPRKTDRIGNGGPARPGGRLLTGSWTGGIQATCPLKSSLKSLRGLDQKGIMDGRKQCDRNNGLQLNC